MPCPPNWPPLTGGTVLLASPSACATVTIAAAPSAATTTSPAWLGTGGPGLGIAGPAGIGWGHSLGIGGRSTRVVAGSWTGLRAQGTWRCCWGRGPIVARGGAQGRSGRWGARGVGGRHSWGLGVLVAVDRLGAIFGWRLQERKNRGSGTRPACSLPTAPLLSSCLTSDLLSTAYILWGTRRLQSSLCLRPIYFQPIQLSQVFPGHCSHSPHESDRG